MISHSNVENKSVSTALKKIVKSVGTDLKTVAKNNIRQYTMIAALLLIWAIFTILTGGTFLTPRNISTLFMQMVTFAIMTSGMLLVMVSGVIDLSAGSVLGTLGALAAWLMARGTSPTFAILITLLAGFLVGCWHGYWVAFRKVPAFIVTLASMLAFRGITLIIAKNQTIDISNESFKLIGSGYIPNISFFGNSLHFTSLILVCLAAILFLVATIRTRGKRKKNGFAVLRPSIEAGKIIIVISAIIGIGMFFINYKGIQYAVLILAAVAIIFTIITTRTPFGRHVYAIGGNIEAARLSGVNIKKTMLGIWMLMGLMAAVGALVYTARLGSAEMNAGMGFELGIIAACIIGGTSTSGGIGTIFGAIIGALVMASLDNGMSLMNLPIMYQYVVKGLILILAVWIDYANRKK